MDREKPLYQELEELTAELLDAQHQLEKVSLRLELTGRRLPKPTHLRMWDGVATAEAKMAMLHSYITKYIEAHPNLDRMH